MYDFRGWSRILIIYVVVFFLHWLKRNEIHTKEGNNSLDIQKLCKGEQLFSFYSWRSSWANLWASKRPEGPNELNKITNIDVPFFLWNIRETYKYSQNDDINEWRITFYNLKKHSMSTLCYLKRKMIKKLRDVLVADYLEMIFDVIFFLEILSSIFCCTEVYPFLMAP